MKGGGGSTYIPYEHLVALGRVPGVGKNVKFGASGADIVNGDTKEVWDGNGVAYSWPTSDTITHLKQASDQAADRGKIVTCQGLAGDYSLVNQSKALDATNSSTLVAWDTPMIRMHSMQMTDDVVASANISAMEATGTTHYATMLAGNNRTLMAIYTVPLGKVALLAQYYVNHINITNKEARSVQFDLWSRNNADGWAKQLRHKKATNKDGTTNVDSQIPVFLTFGAKCDIWLTATPEGAATNVFAGFDLYLYDA